MDIRLVVYRQAVAGDSSETQYELDLQQSPNIITNYNWIDISNPEQRRSNFSQTIKIPFSNNNNQFFENWFDVNLDTLVFSTKVKYTAIIMVDSVPQLEGYIQLKSVYYNARLYEVVVFGDTANFFSDIKDKKLRDAFIDADGVIDRQLDHFNTATNIASSWESPGLTTVESTQTTDIMYPIIDYGHTQSPYSSTMFWNPDVLQTINNDDNTTWSEQLSILGAVRSGDLKPAIRIQRLIQIICQKAGYSIKSTFLGIAQDGTLSDTQWFSRMFMTLASQYSKVRTKSYGGFKYTCSTQNIISNDGYYDDAPNWETVVYDSENLFSTGTDNTITIPYNDETPSVIPTGDLTIQVTLDISLATADSTGASLVGASWFVIGRLVGNSNDFYDAIVGYDFTGQITTQNNYEYVYTATIPSQFNIANSNWEFQFQLDSNDITNAPGVTATSVLNSGSIEILNIGDSMFSNGSANAEVIMSENMPDITQADFVKDLINRFNLIIQSDSDNPNLLLIEPYNDYINSGTTQYWTDKLDISKEQVVKSTNEIQSKELKFSDLEDTDYFNDSYYKSWNTVWGSKNVFIKNDFANGEFSNFSIFSPFIAQGLFNLNQNNTSQAAVASCFEIDEQNQQRKPIESSNPKLFYYSGTPINLSGYDLFSNAWSFRIYSGAYTTLGSTEAYDTGNKFPLCTQYNLDNLDTGITATTKILNWTYYNPFFYTGYTVNVFGESVTTLSLYNEHWSQYINEIYSDEARIMDCYLNLDEQDIFNFSFANPVYIKNTLWRVLSIDNHLVGGNKSTKVRLLKSITKLTYDCDVVPDTFNVNGTISFINPITGASADVTNTCCEDLDNAWTFNQTNNVTGTGICYHNQWSPTSPQDVSTESPSGVSAFGNIISNDPELDSPAMLPMPIFGAAENTVQFRSIGNIQSSTFYMYTTTKDTATAYFGINGMDLRLLRIPDNYMVSLEIELMGTTQIDESTPANVGNVGYFTYTTLLKNQKGTNSYLGTAGGDLKTSNRDTNFPLPTGGFTNFDSDTDNWKPSIAVTGTQKISWVAKIKMFMQTIPQDSDFYNYFALYQNDNQILFQDLDLLEWN
jgi:hypothetical protein